MEDRGGPTQKKVDPPGDRTSVPTGETRETVREGAPVR